MSTTTPDPNRASEADAGRRPDEPDVDTQPTTTAEDDDDA